MIVGHKKQWDFLRSAVSSSRVAHGYLFSGRPHLGKKAIALKFACFLNCQEKDLEKKPCHECPNCRMIEKGTHPDFVLLQKEEGKDIKVDQVEVLIRALSLRVGLDGFKIGIIEQAHLMNPYAQNAILKTLEEPYGETVLILIADSKEFLLPTILSRLQEIRFFPVSRVELNPLFEKKAITPKKKEMILQLAGGRPGKVVQLLEESGFFAKEQKKEEEIKRLLASDLNARFKFADSLAKEEPIQTLISWLYFLRKRLLSCIENKEESTRVMSQIRKMQEAIYLLRRYNVNKKITLQNLMIHL